MFKRILRGIFKGIGYLFVCLVMIPLWAIVTFPAAAIIASIAWTFDHPWKQTFKWCVSYEDKPSTFHPLYDITYFAHIIGLFIVTPLLAFLVFVVFHAF